MTMPWQAKPLSWWAAADLGELQAFLKSERDRGVFKPLFGEGLD